MTRPDLFRKRARSSSSARLADALTDGGPNRGSTARSIPIGTIWSVTWATIKLPFQLIAAPVRWVGRVRTRRKDKKAARREQAEQRRFARMAPRHQAEVLKTRSRFGD